VVISNAYGAVTSSIANLTVVGPNVLTNGSFESPVFTNNSLNTSLPFGWSGSAYVVNGSPYPGSGPFVQNPPAVGPLQYLLQGPASARDGQQYVVMDSGNISQTFQVVTQGIYLISWYDNDLVWYYVREPPAESYILAVKDALATTLVSGGFDANNLGTVQPLAWRKLSMQADLAPGSYALSFEVQPAATVLIDDVSLQPVIPPAASPTLLSFQRPIVLAAGVSLPVRGGAGATWNLDRAISAAGPWTNIGFVILDSNGAGSFQDTNPPTSSAFYRARRP
jgi:hypothetical protein